MTGNQDPTLLLIDIQEGFNDRYWGQRNNLKFEENVARLLDCWRASDLPVIHVQHFSTEEGSPLRPGQVGAHFVKFAEPRPGEKVVTKKVNSAFIGTDLKVYLKERHRNNLVIVGLSTDHCVSTTVRMASNLGFSVVVGEDATATFNRALPDGRIFDADLVHTVALASLNHEFAAIRSTEAIVQLNRSLFL